MTPTPDQVALASAFARANQHLQDPATAWGRCYLDTDAYAAYLASHGVTDVVYVRATGRTYPGREHWALYIPDSPDEIDGSGLVVDVTARQFGTDIPFPLVSDLDTWLDDVSEWLVDHLDYQLVQRTPGRMAEPGRVVLHDCWIREDIDPGPARPTPTPIRPTITHNQEV